MLLELAIIGLLILLAITIYVSLLYFGLFEDIEVKVGKPPYQFGGRTIGYKKQRGKYSEAGALFTNLHSLVPKLNLIGIYFDDPDQGDQINNKYIVGALLSQDEKLREEEIDLLTKNDFQFGQLPVVDHVVNSVFPFKGVISIVIAIRRVYPVIKSYIKEHNLCAHPAIEIYDNQNIYFIWPLAKQDHFHQLHDVDKHIGDSGESTDEDGEDEETENSNGAMRRLSLNRLNIKRDSTSSSFEELQAEEHEEH